MLVAGAASLLASAAGALEVPPLPPPPTSWALQVFPQRPPTSSWARTSCGHRGEPAQPTGAYTIGIDFPGNDIDPCGAVGCVLDRNADHLVCEAKCNATGACHGYIFADADCSGAAGPLCWTKSMLPGRGNQAGCRNSRNMGQPAIPAADIPSKWASEVSASTTPLVAYPRPQMVRVTPAAAGTNPTQLRDKGDVSTWFNLNGLWEWEEAASGQGVGNPPFGRKLARSILVPFPVESCLSGVAPNSSAAIVKSMWYRLEFQVTGTISQKQLLHFGAADWQTSVFLNNKLMGNHTGGYDGFDFDITPYLTSGGNELLVFVFDPSDSGAQPNGKQRISAIDNPGGDTYTPTSGIWQTVWLESVPAAQYIKGLTLNQASSSTLKVQVTVVGAAKQVTYEVLDAQGSVIVKTSVAPSAQASLTIPTSAITLWGPETPHLYDLRISVDGGDTVLAYFALRTFTLGDGPKGKRPLLNGNFTFLAGFLDQSFWPDGQYTAPTDEALAYDVAAVPMFGLNMIRLHQKVNPERWYYAADRLGVVVLQDMIQKYGGATKATVPLFVQDLKAMILGRGNHPCIVQWTAFNEGDCWEVFTDKPYDVAGVVDLIKQLDPTDRLVDTDSGGGANDMHVADVNDIHSYPYPGDPMPSKTQYAMIGEFGGIGAFVKGKEWKPNSCSTYLHVSTPTDEANTYIKMAATIASRVDVVSASVYTQTTDVELECDGFLNYDRSNKFNDADTAAIKKANQAIIHQ